MILRLRQFFFGSLSRQLISGMMIFYIVVIGVFITDLTLRQRGLLLEQKIKQAESLSQSMAVSAEDWLLSKDYDGLQDIAEAQKHYPEVTFAMILDDSGMVVAHTDRQYLGQYVTDMPTMSTTSIIHNTPVLIDVASPVILNGKRIGWVRVGIDRHIVTARLDTMTRDGILYGIVAILVAYFLAYLMGNYITHRIRAIQSVADAVQAGDMDRRVYLDGYDEATILARQFNTMLDTIASDERQLQYANAYNRSLIEASLDPLVTISPGGKITDVNKATELVTGRSRNELILTDFSDYFTDPEKARKGYQKVFDEGSVTDYPLTIRHSDGHITQVLYNASLYKDESGNIIGVFAAARDITERIRAESIMKEKEERLALATLHNGVGIWDWNLQTQEMIWDDSMYALYHMRREDFSGTEEAWRTSLHPDDLERGDREVADAIAGIRPFDTEFRVVWPNGEVHHIKAVAEVFRDEKGVPVRMLGTNMDITGLKRAESAMAEALQKAKRFSDALDNVTAYVYLKDRNHKYVHANKPTLDLFRCSAEELVGSDDTRFFPPETVAHLREIDNKVLEKGEETREEVEVIESGKRIVYWEIKTPIYNNDGQIWGLCGISYDITERKQAEEKIKMFNDELEEKVRQRTIELETANKELEAFAYSVSHDLRAPLRAIDGFSAVIMEDYSDKLDDDGKEYLERVRHAAQKMSDLIDDLLSLSRLTRGELHRVEINLSRIADKVIESLREADPARYVDVRISADMTDEADPGFIEIVLTNLLSNSWKFTSKGNNGKIEFASFEKEGNKVYYIKDNGVGFNMDYSNKLFQPFQRLHTSEEFPGSGIGLATVYRIIRKHGGDIWVESEIGKGATFYFTLKGGAIS